MSRRAAALLAVLLWLFGAAASAAEMAWQTDVDRALAAARTERRAVLLDFWADWCAPCKAMDRDFWSRSDVAERSRRLTTVRVDFDRNKLFARQHNVSALPAVIVLDPWGNSIAAVVGFGDTSQLELILSQIPEDFAPVAPWIAELEKDGKSFTALRGLGAFYFQHKFLGASTQYYERALKSPGAKGDAKARGDVHVALGWDYVNLADAQRGREQFARALEIADLERPDVALFGLVVANGALCRRAEAEKAFGELTTRFPESDATNAARKQMQAAPAQC
ncbi:MAG TPA: thioredoxin family protein [Thermoanaerobaculia bacterium]|nr:thioredoxin family protein [Thermoanaerobaculia bacterium]HXT52808.1 thioredoxin family protein [Thermoanaerobaculia bacterium]